MVEHKTVTDCVRLLKPWKSLFRIREYYLLRENYIGWINGQNKFNKLIYSKDFFNVTSFLFVHKVLIFPEEKKLACQDPCPDHSSSCSVLPWAKSGHPEKRKKKTHFEEKGCLEFVKLQIY